jgi:hypothetical protein
VRDFRITELDRQHAETLLVKSPHLIQNTLSWFDFIREFSGEADRSITIWDGGTPIAFLLALQHWGLIQSLPYPASYSGLVAEPDLARDDLRAIMERICEHYRDWADVFSLCTTPFDSSTIDRSDLFDFALENKILYIDLTTDLLSDTTSRFRNNLRRNLGKAEDAEVRVKCFVDDEIEELWYRRYQRRMQELGVACLPIEFFSAMRRHLQPRGGYQLFSAWADEDYLGGILSVGNDYCADYYLSVFDRDYDFSQCSTYTFYHFLLWAKARGIKVLNLRSSPARDSEVYHFKRSWGAKGGRHEYLVKILKNREKVLSQAREEIAAKYRFHFYLPFSALRQQAETEIMAEASI